ncbi:THO complex subunit 4A-like isoform X2 [Miscanthus floridulus]|uniref:THO complex subunit 4A-like isoform X2 n=1 Tax=Miscanthus floridulus TaxID=154761 RepID=UPI0034588E5B
MKSPLLSVSNRPPRWGGTGNKRRNRGRGRRKPGRGAEAVAGLGCLVPEKRRPGPTEAMGPIPTTYIRQQPTHATRLSGVAAHLPPSAALLLLPPPPEKRETESMADALDMSLDDLISKSRSTHQHPGGGRPAYRGGVPAPTASRRRFNTRAAAAPYLRRATFSFKPLVRPMDYAGYRAAQPRPPMVSALDEPTKLYISNLDYGVSNDDIKELFSDVGDIKRYSINYDRSGRSKGTAEVVFSRRSDALAAVKRYNNVQLDGKPMKIEIIGTNIEAPLPPTAIFSFNPPAGNFNLPFKRLDRASTVVGRVYMRIQEEAWPKEKNECALGHV